MNIQYFKDKFNNNIKVVSYLTKGSFGEIYLCEVNENKNCVMKVEDAKSGSIYCEINFLTRLKFNPSIYLPELITFGVYNNFRYFIIERYDKTIMEYLKDNSIDTFNFILLYNNILKALYHMQSIGFSHGDINPLNIMFKKHNDFNTIVLIDFSLSYNYSKLHHMVRRNMKIRNNGNINFSSLDIMKGYRVTARGDLQNFGFVLEYLINSLPWYGFNFQKIYNMKKVYESTDPNINKLIQSYKTLDYLEKFDLDSYMI